MINKPRHLLENNHDTSDHFHKNVFVDAHRTEALVISPYTQKGKVDTTIYDQTLIYRTMEMILAMKTEAQFDASVIPMFNAFTIHPNFAPYEAEEPIYLLNAKIGQDASMATVSMTL